MLNKRFSFVLVSILLCLVAFTACGDNRVSNSLVGKWEQTSVAGMPMLMSATKTGATVEFQDNGNAIYGSQAAKYSILGDNIKLEIGQFNVVWPMKLQGNQVTFTNGDGKSVVLQRK
ncbi:MAG TPA: hypothetical protein VH186_15660 [Chloroflexia bacterium]|nr:hypothetical protein [Chloroflexia bacterium]